ncbi:TPA: polysaccharide pyruvyl transferase family protein [Citrobacter farmeri]|uniref:polysaccharide pyruvyl transferase family protein n=1 Tax=Citrobacter farmeri TaxID=67824 RepID=UPI001A1BD45B|nr:polysaccharide pyruvyl transferase family protein [Citrobacter farmeri]MBU5646946.1 polysaccharide pyruvyl transferase family protein [Pluralibacter sp. S54_ASV_43]HAT3757333.1 polysaccharide pyruvyl transferase family protein [Citrobacter amalonaticus]QZE47705.1 polysaccharide pyruvyl transferase family protein [Citrobacter farmeri]HCB1593905.1 polysaccharide pyruvyl transferase family protein [Citrobacter farmeri]HCB1652134.1 polysaccharide pyruvyl transferase family protein [Citrobacter 
MKTIKVCLAWHNINSNNYGVSALAIAQVALLVEAAKRANVNVEIETLGTPFVNELTIKEEVEKRLKVKLTHNDFSLKNLVRSLTKLDFSVFSLFRKYDIVMDIGEGDSFTDIYGIKRFIIVSLTKYLALRAKKKLILSPQTIGPFNKKISYFVSRYLMSKCDAVFSRDYKTTQFVRAMGIECVEVSDVAFTLPYDSLPKIINSVGINISGLLWNGGYSGNNQFGLTVDYQKFVKEAIENFRTRGKSVHLVAHVIADHLPVEDDYRICVQIKKMFSDDEGVILGPKFTSPIQAKSYISQLEFFTGSRMHATIGSLSAGVITVPIAYSRKFSGVFGSLDYPFTLDAYSLDTEGLLSQLFEYYDHQFQLMHSSMINARNRALQRNEKYVGYLQELLHHE